MNNKFFKLVSLALACVILVFVISLLYGIFVLPRMNKRIICIQSLSRSCFLGTPVCFNFPNPCYTPPLWFPAKNNRLDF